MEMMTLSNPPPGDIAQSKQSNDSSFTQSGLGLKINDIPPVASHDSTRLILNPFPCQILLQKILWLWMYLYHDLFSQR